MNGDGHPRGVSRAAVATAFTITELGVVVGLVVWIWGVPAAVMAVGGVALWCRRALARRRAGEDDRGSSALVPAAS